MTVAAWRSLRVGSVRLPGDLRAGHVAVTLAISVLGLIVFLHVPPFMAAGADLSDSTQVDYARNIWQETQTSLALVALVLPWLVYAIIWAGAPWGRRVLLAISTAAVVFTTWLALLSAQSYTALPRQVTGVVDHLQDRAISIRGEGSFYLVLSNAELQGDESWLRPGTSVLLWVSPRGHAGAVGPVQLGD
ncbi:MAG: hypothetical protein E6I88_03675 [Chloroflexi bacterium]|nr:MAG: hypothetical protein E6I88_03675 [Chloroflexota bacterium]